MINWLHNNYSIFIAQCLPQLIKQILLKNNELVIKSPYYYLYPILKFLKNNLFCRFASLNDIACCDRLINCRFAIVYLLISPTSNIRIRIYVEAQEAYHLFSISQIFSGSNWLEREVWDLFGVFFKYHPNLKRILNDYAYA